MQIVGEASGLPRKRKIIFHSYLLTPISYLLEGGSIMFLNIVTADGAAEVIREMKARAAGARGDIEQIVRGVMADVQVRGWDAVVEYAEKFDGKVPYIVEQSVLDEAYNACDPKLIVADEPISALDVSIRAQVLNLMNKLKAEKNLTYLFIAHDLSVVRFIADRIAVIHLGEIVEIADSETLFQCPLHPYTISLLSAVPMPDPVVERTRRAIVYDPSKLDQSGALRSLREIRPGHFVFATDKEMEGYEKKLAEIENAKNQ